MFGEEPEMIYRGWIVYGVGAGLILLVFLIFVAAGWPGKPDSCTNIDPDTGIQATPAPGDPADTCYCEQFSVSDVVNHKSGVRQPVNTWFNLYALLTGLLVTWQVWSDRNSGESQNPMRRPTSWIPDVYIFAVVFLGLGSMWFHASLTEAVSWMDGLSMYVYAGFLAIYSIYRFCSNGTVLGFIPRGIFFGIFYPVTFVVYTILGQKIDLPKSFPLPISAILIGTLITVYLLFEILHLTINKTWQSWTTSKKVYSGALWFGALASFVFAFVFWKLSQTGGKMCDPTSFFQPHGLLWHPLAGVMAVLLFYYWREDFEQYQPTEI
jgi:hypothetical protein